MPTGRLAGQCGTLSREELPEVGVRGDENSLLGASGVQDFLVNVSAKAAL